MGYMYDLNRAFVVGYDSDATRFLRKTYGGNRPR